MMRQFGRIYLKETEGYKGLDRSLGVLFDLKCPPKDYKMVYKDHENNVLLVGDEPWEYVLNCSFCFINVFRSLVIVIFSGHVSNLVFACL